MYFILFRNKTTKIQLTIVYHYCLRYYKDSQSNCFLGLCLE